MCIISRTEYWGCRQRWLLVQFLVEKQFHWTVMSSKQLQPICIWDKSLVLSGPESQEWYLAAGGLLHWIILSRNPESQICNKSLKFHPNKAALETFFLLCENYLPWQILGYHAICYLNAENRFLFSICPFLWQETRQRRKFIFLLN